LAGVVYIGSVPWKIFARIAGDSRRDVYWIAPERIARNALQIRRADFSNSAGLRLYWSQ